ncbi:MAG: ribokinase, partial [Anaerolineae bacterium]|nr:ribokinase [Anaerolineae bacterium]
MSKITVVGSSNVDLVVTVSHLPAPGETILGKDFMQALGGKGANQAVGAARLGAKVTFVARIGDDSYGELCLSAYQQEGMNTDFVLKTHDTPNGIALIGVAENGENNIIVVSGANMKVTPEDVQAAEDEIRTSDALLLQLEIPDDANQMAIEIAHQHRIPIILNPAPYHDLPREWLQKVTVLTPNEHEAHQMIGGTVKNEEELAKGILGLGVQSAVITMGARGALAAGSWGRVFVPAREVKPIDTTGAGDSFNAALAVALAEGSALHEAVRFASAAAALSVTKAGAQP